MSIKSDKWIRYMAENHGMISPFEPGQVTHDAAGRKLVSYGTSSYGYDIRCADEFKIFTNVNSVVVDPKNFDEKAFVDFKGDVCIIPPNSFVLARTVEYFKIPRSVLTVCLGKSTYARCFSGDTKVAVSNGGCKTFLDLIRDQENGVRNWGYSVDESGSIVLAELEAARKIGHEKVIEVTLDNGEKIKCTPDHKFLLRNGTFIEAQHLVAGSSLMPLYRTDQRQAVPENNHKVVEVKELGATEDVYCLSVPAYENFALDCGVFVKNCGIIVNVTPFEPEWEGHVTLEFSNTTPLPMKLYAGEGCAQVLFFESDEVCETSYKDRGGKYQGQLGVTLPRMFSAP
jgi:deoxycytidine triphosphate deaminase